MSAGRKKFEIWTAISLALFLMFAVFFIYPICTLLRQAFTTKEAAFTLDNFIKFFSKPYYYNTIFNSFKVSLAVMAVSRHRHRHVIFLLVLRAERVKVHPRFQHTVLHVRAVHRGICVDTAAWAFGRDDAHAQGTRDKGGQYIRLRRHSARTGDKAVPARDDLHERYVRQSRQQSHGGLVQPRLHGSAPVFQRCSAPLHAHDPRRRAVGIHARVRRLRHAHTHRRGLSHLHGRDIQAVSE